MLDIKFVRANPELVKENIKKKFQDSKLVLVDEVIAIDEELRQIKAKADSMRARINSISGEIGKLMREKKVEEANACKKEANEINAELKEIAIKEEELGKELKKKMMVIPNIIDPSVPIGKDDSENVELKKFLEPRVPEFEIPYHLDIMEKVNGIDLDSARKVAGNGFY